jgi:hypothetical protein
MRRSLAAAAALTAAAATVLAGAPPAAADTNIEVEAGYVDGQIVPGRPVPIRVEVRSDELATGVVTVTPYTLGQPGESVSSPIEVAGGSVKDYLLVMPSRWEGTVGPSEVRVALTPADGGDAVAEGTASLAWNDQVEVVGLLPGFASQAPDPVALPMDVGRAVFARLDAAALATPGALGPLGSIVAGPDGFGDLPPESQRNVLEWVEDGGQLLVDAAPGSAVPGLPEEWQPSGTRQPAGDGWVRFTDGDAARGRWGSIIEPNRQFAGTFGADMMCCALSVPDSVARDAGLRVPAVGWLVVFLVAYVVIVGPITFLVVRRTRRTTVAWVAVPLVAVLFTGAAFVAGSNLRSGAGASHGSVVQTSPLGDRVNSYVGVVSRSGGDPTAWFPEGWRGGGVGAGDLGLPPGLVLPDGDMPMGALVDPVPLEDDGRPGFRLPLNAGEYGMIAGNGRIEEDRPLTVTATAGADGGVTGTVTNASGHDLVDTIVVVAGRTASVGSVADGETADWEIPPDPVGPPLDPWLAVERPWASAIGDDRELDTDSPVNYSVYSATIGHDVDTYPPGVAVAAGWTRDWSPPVELGGGLEGGRTAFVTRASVAAEPGTVPAASVRREFVRGPGAVTFNPPVQVPNWGDAQGAVVRFTLPEGADPDTRLTLDASGGVARAEVWDGQRWVMTDLAAAPGADDFNADPFGVARSVDLPAGVVHDGVVYVRIAAAADGGSRMTLELGQAS